MSGASARRTDVSRPLAKMSDSEFLAYLRSTKGKGKTLAEVFAEDELALEQRCVVLTLANVLRMLERPIAAKEWWAPTRIRGYVSASRVARFMRLTGAREVSDGERLTLIVDTGFTVGPRELRFSPKEEVGHPIVWWCADHEEKGQHVEHEALGLHLTSTRARDEATWNTHRADHLVWTSARVAWTKVTPFQTTDVALDGERRSACEMCVYAERRERAPSDEWRQKFFVVTPWGDVTADSQTEIDAIVKRIRDYTSFAYEVPFTVPSLTG